MIVDGEIVHATLGLFKRDDDGWIGRSAPGADFFDLFAMAAHDEWDDHPPPDGAFETLERAKADIVALKAQAVEAVCAARQAGLNWRAGPPVEAWTIVEVRVDLAGDLWLTLLEYETDEYSHWLVRMRDGRVRRKPALPLRGAPDEAGGLV